MSLVTESVEGAVGIVTLNDPATLNAMTPALMGALSAAIERTAAREDVRALVLTGAGRGFCSGQNLKARDALTGDLVESVMHHYFPVFRALRECAVPVVTAVNGVAAGGGFSLAIASDFVLAAQSASFIQVFSRIALIPDLGSTWLLPRMIGRMRALQLMMTNAPLSAAQAKEWGLVLDVVPDDRLMTEAKGLAARLAEGPTATLVATRRAVDQGFDSDFASQFRRELEIQREVRSSHDAVEGVAAFVEKRKARFLGR